MWMCLRQAAYLWLAVASCVQALCYIVKEDEGVIEQQTDLALVSEVQNQLIATDIN